MSGKESFHIQEDFFEMDSNFTPHLQIGEDLEPVFIHDANDLARMTREKDPRQRLIAIDYTDGEGEKVVTFLDPNKKLKAGQTFHKSIVWAVRKTPELLNAAKSAK